MTKERIHQACTIIFLIAILNFLSFCVITVLIGGDALNGEIENGHYYLGGGGQHTEVNWFVFTYSKLHALSLCITHPLAMFAGIAYWASGETITWKGVTRTIKEPPRHPILRSFYALDSFAWKVSDTIQGVFWRLFDSWRQPDVEFFTRLSKEECLKELFEAFDRDPSFYKLKKPVGGYLYGTHFCLLKQYKYNIFFRNNVIFLTLFGRLVQTPQGTYVRAWHRLTTMSISFLTLWFGIAITVFPGVVLMVYNPNPVLSLLRDNVSTVVSCEIILVLMAIFTLLVVQSGSSVGARTNDDLAHFLRQVLTSEGQDNRF